MTIPINNNLITTWEPKIQGLVNKYYVNGMDKDDLIQELRMVLMRCAEKYDTSKSTAIFHTHDDVLLVDGKHQDRRPRLQCE